jgi:dihydrofolate reductase
MNNIEAIVAFDNNYGIAKNGQIPWKNKTDMLFFKQKTINNIVIMGSKTLLTLPKGNPLTDRLNIVLTHNTNKYVNKKNDNLLFLDESSLLDFIHYPDKYIVRDDHKYLKSDYKMYIIGGQQIYNLLYKYCSTFWITKLKSNYECDLSFSKEILDSFSNRIIEYENDELVISKLIRQ